MNYAIGDEMIVKKDLILMLGYIYSNITTKSYNWRTGVPSGPSGMYDEGASSYTASAVYKATKDLSLYSTWIQATEAGTYVGLNASPRYRNEGEYLPPTQSDQFEIGAKYNWNGILFALSGFYINKANTFDDFHTDGTRTLTQDGREIRKGVEFSATGKLTKSLTVMTGATGFDATIKKTNNASQRGKTPGNTPLFLAKIYIEYELPFLKNLFITGGVFHTGSMYYNTNNVHKLTDVTTGDVGLRYSRKIKDFDVTFRFNVQNVTDEWYWRRSSLGDLGDPRTFTCSTTISF
jgi:iron complex outermembrane receptor protein